jgi:DNA-directed RNA polymerase specialized sigma24 family protein
VWHVHVGGKVAGLARDLLHCCASRCQNAAATDEVAQSVYVRLSGHRFVSFIEVIRCQPD